MNLSIDERTKHRLTGLVVLAAIAIIFLPAMLKKSNQRLEENIHLSVQIPPKPTVPKVAAIEEKAVFETVKVEKLPLPKAIQPTRASQIARIDDLQAKPKALPIVKKAPVVAAKPKVIAKPAIKKPLQLTKAPIKVSTAVSEQYAVQLASFAVQKNAEALVLQLRDQGFKARYQVISSGSGSVYKVTAGQVDDRADAKLLKQKLSDELKIEGFIVKREVS